MQLRLPFADGRGRKELATAAAPCIYCGAAGGTRDHVPPKALLAEPWPSNLRTVPACAPCNHSWSLDEQYLAVVLAHISSNPRLSSSLEAGGPIDRALAAAPRLDERIISSLAVEADGRISLAPEIDRLSRVMAKTAFGLYCLKYGHGRSLAEFRGMHYCGPGEELPQRLVAAQWNWPGLRRKRWTVVQKGIFSFLFARGWLADDPLLYCLINLADTLLVAVCCPAPVGRPLATRLRSKPWP